MRMTDAQEMARLHPDTFAAPAKAELDRIMPGNYVKACFNDKERMWVLVETVDGETMTGKLANKPVLLPMDHGQPVTLEKRHVYTILEA